MAGQKQKNRKIDRARKSPQNLRYRNENRHEKSHVRRITKHLERYSNNDKVAAAALVTYRAKAGYMNTRPK